MRPMWLMIAGAVVAVGLAALGGPGAGAATPEFEEAPCAMAPPDGVPAETMRCGYVTVPENRAKQSGRQVRLAVAVLEARSQPKREPVLYLSGGPGAPALDSDLYGFGAARVRDSFPDRDVVFYDQRGTGLSTPDMRCPETARLTVDNLTHGWTRDEARAAGDAAIRACIERLVASGIDLDHYSSADSGKDIADVMSALGYETFNLYGVSYGTRLALTVMRDHPERISSVVLDSVYPVSVDLWMGQGRSFMRSLEELLDGCAADAECHAAYPDLEETYWNLVNRANAEPIQVTIEDVDGTPLELLVDGDAIITGTFTAFYDAGLIPLLPFAADEIARGNTAILTSLAQQLVFSFSSIADGMHAAVNCNEEIPFFTAASQASLTAGVRREVLDAALGIFAPEDLELALDQCDDWDTPAPAAYENAPVESAIPTLVLTGEFDPITPPSYGTLAAETLSNSYSFEFPSTGHAVIFSQWDCAAPLVAAFLDDPVNAPDGACVGRIPPPDFVVAAPEPEPTPTTGAGVIAPPDTGDGAAGGGPGAALLLLALGACGLAATAVGLRRVMK